MGKLGATNLDIVMTPLSFRGDVVPQHSRRAQTAKARKDRLQSDRQHHWTADEDNASASSHGRHDYIKGEELLELLMPKAREPPATPAPSCRSPSAIADQRGRHPQQRLVQSARASLNPMSPAACAPGASGAGLGAPGAWFFTPGSSGPPPGQRGLSTHAASRVDTISSRALMTDPIAHCLAAVPTAPLQPTPPLKHPTPRAPTPRAHQGAHQSRHERPALAAPALQPLAGAVCVVEAAVTPWVQGAAPTSVDLTVEKTVEKTVESMATPQPQQQHPGACVALEPASGQCRVTPASVSAAADAGRALSDTTGLHIPPDVDEMDEASPSED